MIVLLVSYPTITSVRFGQWTLFPLLLLSLAWVAWRRNRLALAGSILGFLAAVKLFFGAYLLFFLARREWRAALGFTASWVACTVAAIAVMGVAPSFEYLAILRSADWFGASWNGSFMGFFSRVFGGGGGVSLVHVPGLSPVVAYGAAALALGSLFLVRSPEADQPAPGIRNDLSFAAVVPVMLLASPFGWMYYFPFLVLPLVVLWKARSRIKNGRVLGLLLALAWLLGSFPQELIHVQNLTGNPVDVLLRWGVYTYSLLLFLGLTKGTERALLPTSAPT